MRKAARILLWVYVFTLPWDNMLQFGDRIGSVGRVAGLIALAGCIALISLTGCMRRPKVFHILSAGYFIIVILSLFWTSDTVSTSFAIRTYSQSIMVVWMIWEVGTDRSHLFSFATAYVSGAYVGALSVLHNFSATTVLANAKEARFTADGWNSNDIALALAIAIPPSLYFATQGARRITRWLARGYLILGSIAIVLTSSRSGIAVTAIGISGLPLFLRRQTVSSRLWMALSFVCTCVLALHYAPQQSWDRFATIYTSVVGGDLNSRELIWQIGLRTFAGNNWLVGVGAGAFQPGVGSYYSAHNTYLAVLVEQGLLGFTLFCAILGGVIHSLRGLNGEERWMCFFMFLSWAFGASTLGWTMNRVTWFVLGFIVSFGYSDRRDTGVLDPEFAHGASRLAVSRV
jgi:hypothetical protein